MTPLLRITTTQEKDRNIVKVDGQLSGAEAEVLLRTCEGFPGNLVVDLSDLEIADDAGLKALSLLKARGASLVRARPYMSMLLEGASKANPKGTP